jgi:3'-phosphoadenosine 5'-phosphosulfate sulfotransferase
MHKRALEDLMEKYSPGWEISTCEGHDGLSELQKLFKQMPDDDLIAVLSHLTIKFYEVHEVILAE